MAPLCSKGDNKTCFKSLKRVEAVITKDYLLEKARIPLGSAETQPLSSMNSEDLQADGVFGDEIMSAKASGKGSSKYTKGSSS